MSDWLSRWLNDPSVPDHLKWNGPSVNSCGPGCSLCMQSFHCFRAECGDDAYVAALARQDQEDAERRDENGSTR